MRLLHFLLQLQLADSLVVTIRTCVRYRKPDLAVDRWTVIATCRCLLGPAGTETELVALVLVVVTAPQAGPRPLHTLTLKCQRARTHELPAEIHLELPTVMRHVLPSLVCVATWSA